MWIDGAPTTGATSTGVEITVPTGVTSTYRVLIVATTADGDDWGWQASGLPDGAELTILDDRAATNMRVTVLSGTGFTAADTFTVSHSISAKTVTIHHLYSDTYMAVSPVAAGIRSGWSTAVTSGSHTVSAIGDPTMVVAAERTLATPTAVSSVVTSEGDSVTDIYYSEDAATSASVYVGTYDASATGAQDATVTYDDGSGNAYAALIASPQVIAVGAEIDLRWRVDATVGSETDLRWRVDAAVGSETDLRWRVDAAVGAEADLRWRVRVRPTRAVGDIEMWWIHEVSIERYEGRTVYGHSYADPETILAAVIDKRARVRTAAGDTVISSTGVYMANDETMVPVGSRVTLPAEFGGRISHVLTSSVLRTGLGTPDHQELRLE